jgi:hypothetical protein
MLLRRHNSLRLGRLKAESHASSLGPKLECSDRFKLVSLVREVERVCRKPMSRISASPPANNRPEVWHVPVRSRDFKLLRLLRVAAAAGFRMQYVSAKLLMLVSEEKDSEGG